MIRTFNLINTNNKKSKDIDFMLSSIFSKKISSFENSNEALQSYHYSSIVIDNYQISRNVHYIKHYKTNRTNDHITSLKRRQQLRYNQNQPTTFQETNVHVPSSINLLLISYPQQPVSSCPYRMKKTKCIVPLSPLINNKRAVRTRVHGH
ncbi:unnamed protein product [Rotaria sp. Silwood1]|nr:unnamed protein product [Rotaria sp. Silwood1]